MKDQSKIKIDRSRFFLGFWREIRYIKNTKALLAAVLLYPLIVIFSLFYVFEHEIVDKVPITVVDLDRTQSSRDLIQAIGAASDVNVVARAHTMEEAKDQLLRGEIFSILFIPTDFEKKMLGNKQPEVVTFTNMQYMSMGLTITSAYPAAFATHLGGLQAARLMDQGMDAKLAMQELTPISTDLHPLFNPTINYVHTLVNGVAPTILQVIIMVSIAYSVIRVKYSKLGMLGLLRENGNSVFRMLTNKLLPYVLAFLGALCVFDIGLIVFFDIAFNGSVTLEVISSTIFIISAGLFVVAATVWIPGRAVNFGVASITTSPAFGYIGLYYPRISMDSFAYIWSNALPLTWYMEARLDQTLRAAGLLASSTEIIMMIIIAVVAYILIFLRMWLYQREANRHA